MVRLLLVAALGIVGSMLPAPADGQPPVRHPELCVDAACGGLSERDCADTTNLGRLLQACTANYNGECVRVSCGLLGALDCNEVSEVIAIARACSNNVDGACVTAICRRLGRTGCDEPEEVAAVARQCGRANPYAIP
jgi:hypothetical protein